MGAKEIQPKRWLNMNQLLAEKIVPWSKSTLKRRMEYEGFPYINDTSGPLFDLDDVEKWMKRRKKNV